MVARLLKQAAQNEKVREGAAVVVTAVGRGAWKRRKERREQEKAAEAEHRAQQNARAADRRVRKAHLQDAIEHARSVGGLYSEDTQVAGCERQVVWLNGKAIRAYPPLTEEELNGRPLGDRQELAYFPEHQMKEPMSDEGS